MSGRKFDAQVVLTPKNSTRGQLLEKFVLARIVTMTGVDIGLFDYDRHNSIYFFAMNSDEQIYLRYGGRDAEDANTYLNMDSLELALKAGLRQHELYQAGKLLREMRPAPFFPEEIDSLKTQVIEKNRCVECHLIGDYLAQDLEKAGKLDKRKVLYPSPDLKRLGIYLDIPKGLVIDRVAGPAAASGLQAGDEIVSFGGKPVFTFGDLQYRWGKLDRDAKKAPMEVVRRSTKKKIVFTLPDEWWYTDTGHRYWTSEPMVYFTTKALADTSKRALGGKSSWMAEVDEIDPLAESLDVHKLEKGDVILSVDGAVRSPLTKRPELYLKLTVRAGDTSKLRVLRKGVEVDVLVRTHRQYFRKQRTD